jgi:hypothetical protein
MWRRRRMHAARTRCARSPIFGHRPAFRPGSVRLLVPRSGPAGRGSPSRAVSSSVNNRTKCYKSLLQILKVWKGCSELLKENGGVDGTRRRSPPGPLMAHSGIHSSIFQPVTRTRSHPFRPEAPSRTHPMRHLRHVGRHWLAVCILRPRSCSTSTFSTSQRGSRVEPRVRASRRVQRPDRGSRQPEGWRR